MSKKGSDTLHQFFQSPSKGEKRYISVFIQKQEIHEEDIYSNLMPSTGRKYIMRIN